MLLMVTVSSCVCSVLVGEPHVLVWLDTLLLVMEQAAVSLELWWSDQYMYKIEVYFKTSILKIKFNSNNELERTISYKSLFITVVFTIQCSDL